MFRVTIRKWYHEVDGFHKNSIRYEIEHEKLSECMESLRFMQENNDLAKFSPWEIMYVKDLSEEEGDANE